MLVFRLTRNIGISISLPSTPDNSHPYVYRGELRGLRIEHREFTYFLVSWNAIVLRRLSRRNRAEMPNRSVSVVSRCSIKGKWRKALPRSKRGAIGFRSRIHWKETVARSKVAKLKPRESVNHDRRVSRSSVAGWSLNIRYRFDRSQARAPGTTERFWSGVHSSIIRCPSLHGISLWNPFCQPQKLRYVLTSAAFRSPPTR